MDLQDDMVAFLESFEHTGIYIIDRETMEVYFENSTAQKYTVKDRVGQPCYLVHGNKSMCASCPLRNKERKTYVNRDDHGMVFSVTAKDTIWKGIPTYTIVVEKEKDIPKRKSLSEESLDRMNRALHASIVSYLDVNMENEMCQAIHFSEDGNHQIYEMPYLDYVKKICFHNYVLKEDQLRAEKELGITKLRELNQDSEGPLERSIRFRVQGSDHQIHVLESTAYIMRDELPHHIAIIGKEVTQEEKNRVQLSLYNKLVSNAVAIYQLNLTQNTFQNILGYDLMTDQVKKDLSACKNIDDLYEFIVKYTVGEDEKWKAQAFLDRKGQLELFESNNSIIHERLPIDMDDGSYMWLDVTCNMLRDPLSGDVEALLYSEIVDDDVISDNMINQMISNDYDYLAVFDLQNHTNKVYTNNVRYRKEDMERNLAPENREAYFRKIYAGEDFDTFLYHNSISYIRKKLSENEKFENYYYVKEEDGRITYKKETLSYLNGDTRHLLFSRTDNTDAVKTQEESKNNLTEALEKARKATEEKTELFARMSHDLRTPMSGILGMTALSKTEEDVKVLHNNMMRIDASAKYMIRMINDTLDMKRIETGNLELKPKIGKCSFFIENLEEMVRPSVEEKKLIFQVVNKNIDLERYAVFDEERMKQIFTNLMSNAIKYTPEGGTVRFTMECEKHENGIDYDVFEVADTGIGMSKEFIRREIFQPYAQENNNLTGKYAGPGLGLAITKSLVELMHGRIEVESELNEGTTFRVYLAIPIADMEKVTEEEQQKNQKRITAEKILNHKTILLCEDHPLNAEIGKRLLQNVGCNVVVAKDGEEGVAYFASAKPYSIHAILMDIKMPKVNGLEATVAIRNLERPDAKTVPIIAMTANAFEEDKKASKEAGMNEHLAKPIVPATLYEILEKYLQ